MPFPLVVLDASAALALLLADEEGAETAKVIEDIIHINGQIFVPGIFWYELANRMLSAERGDRMKREEIIAAGQYFSELPFVTHTCSDPSDRQRIHELARKHDLSFYDASYLELALRHQAPLKTCDAHLIDLKDAYPAVFPGAG
jgi:predicted nucleic acid-binding protein